MIVKAKFRCNSIVDTKMQGGYTERQVQLSAVTSKDGDNADYSKYTPYGEIKMNISEDTAAYNHFQPGKDYYLTFEEA